MRASSDPEGVELSHLAAACQLHDGAILEIGSGAGKLTWQYASLPRRLAGIDPAMSALRQARLAAPPSPPPVSFLQAVGEALPFRSQAFDVALFASSL